MSVSDDLDEKPDLTKGQTARIFAEIVEDRIKKLERLERRPPGKYTHKRIADLREVIRNCYAAYYHLNKEE